jgi:hypothetical protein
MAPLDDEFHFVVASANRAVRRQRQPCEEASGNSLARHLDHFYEAISMQIARRAERYLEAPDDTVREDAIVEMRQILGKIKKAQNNLDWLEAARRTSLDLGSRWFVEDVAHTLIDSNFELVFLSETKNSYETTSDPYEPVISDWGTGIPESEPTNVLIFLPRREESSGLLHPLIVHELAHVADQRSRLVAGLWEEAKDRQRFASRFESAAVALAEKEESDVQVATEAIAAMLGSRLSEALCDSIAAHVLGPTYLYSFLVEVAAANMDNPTPKHPPPRQRIRRILEDLDRLGWGKAMSDNDPELSSWIRDLAADTPPLESYESFLHWSIDELAALTRKVARRAVKGRMFRPDDEQFNEVVQMLAAGIPPAQRRNRKPVSRELIIFACWCVALKSAGGGPQHLPDASERPELAEILPAALELSALVSAWKVS